MDVILIAPGAVAGNRWGSRDVPYHTTLYGEVLTSQRSQIHSEKQCRGSFSTFSYFNLKTSKTS